LSLSRKHYIKIAELINQESKSNKETFSAETEEERCYALQGQVSVIAEKLADYFKTDNPNFNSELFLKACGVKE